MRHVVMTSGGITSWATARLVADRYGTDDLTLLFADTMAEDEDLYRFNRDVEVNIGVPITRVADGRTPTEVFRDRKYLGNTRIAPCSVHLKQMPCRSWLEANTDPTDTILYVGIDWTELHRLPGIERGWAPWRVQAPLCDPPYRDKTHWIEAAKVAGLAPPRLYALGFAHNNCGGACVRAGHAQWAHLLKVFPDRYLAAEEAEEAFREDHGDVAILRDRRGGVLRPLTLRQLRQRVEAETDAGPPAYDRQDIGGCGCFTEVESEVIADAA